LLVQEATAIIQQMVKEGLIQKQGRHYML
jgi:hypothetical protein